MERLNLDYLRKKWKNDIKYYWEDIKKEFDNYFEMLKTTTRWKPQEKLTKSREETLKDFSLNDEKLVDPLFLPEMLDLLVEIKENNFNLFSRDWISNGYNHYDRAYYLKNRLIPGISALVQEIKDFKITQFNSLYDKPEFEASKKKFINKDFEKFGLKQYSHHLDLINSIAYHDKFYVILPILLRTLFENILHDIFKISLDDRHKLLYFDKKKTRVADFSVLIELLNQLRQNEYKDAIRSNVNPKTIEILNEVKEKGNLTVHEVGRIIHKTYAKEIQDGIDLALDSLLISYHKLENVKIIIKPERLEKISKKIGLDRKIATIKKKKEAPIARMEDMSELKRFAFLKRFIFLLQKYDDIRDDEREETETTRELCGLSKQLKIIKFEVRKEILPDGLSDIFPALNMVYDNNFKFAFEAIELPNYFKIKSKQEGKSYFSKDYFKEETQTGLEALDNAIDSGDLIPEWKTHKPGVINDFIKYLVSRMEDLRLYPLINEIKADRNVLNNFIRIQKFIEYLFSEEHLSNEARNDERVISELTWIKQNEKELNDYFTVFRRKDEPSKYDKILSFLNGKYLIQFRKHLPFKSIIRTGDQIIESSTKKKVKSKLYEMFDSIKNYFKDNFKLKL